MSRRLADDLARVLAAEPLGLPGVELAARLHRRRTVLVASLRADPRFEHSGRTRGSRWRVIAKEGQGSIGNGLGSNDLPWDELDPSGVPVTGRRAESAA